MSLPEKAEHLQFSRRKESVGRTVAGEPLDGPSDDAASAMDGPDCIAELVVADGLGDVSNCTGRKRAVEIFSSLGAGEHQNLRTRVDFP